MGKAKRKSRQPTPESLNPLLAPLQALTSLLSEFDDKGVVIGGIAASILGAPRFTADLDAVFLLSTADIPKLLKAASAQGIEPRISDAQTFARTNRVLLLRHVASGTDIDLSLGMLPFEIEMVERSRLIEVGSIKLRLPTPEDLIILKAVAHRSKDMADIQAVALNHPDMDKARIQFWVEQFGVALDLPNLWREIEKLLQ
jgi:predicted nucleotidyltransferase